KGGETADHTALVELAGDFVELLQSHARLRRSPLPGTLTHLLRTQLTLQRLQHVPLAVRQLHDPGVEHRSWLRRTGARLHPATPDVTDSEREEPPRRHHPVAP